MQLLLSGNNLVKPDRMGMAVSIEARTPFLDWRMMEFAFRSRGDTKLRRTATRSTGTSSAVAPLIGDDLAYRRKQMFTVPVGEWFRGDELHGWLRGPAARQRPAAAAVRAGAHRRAAAARIATAAPTTRASCARWRRWRCGTEAVQA